MKNILILLFFPFFLFSQETIFNPGQSYTLFNGDSVKLALKEGWYIQHADRIGTYTKDGKIIWGTSEPVYQGPSLRDIKTQKIYTSDWKVETGWKTVCDGKNISCTDHQWLNASEQAGDYNTTKFEIGLSKGDMLQECRVCVKCKRMETQLTFMGNGTNPFVWEATLMTYKQMLETSDKK